MGGIRLQVRKQAALILHSEGWDTQHISLALYMSRASVERAIVDAYYNQLTMEHGYATKQDPQVRDSATSDGRNRSRDDNSGEPWDMSRVWRRRIRVRAGRREV